MTKTIFKLSITLAVIAFTAMATLYLYADVISVSLPPWDMCGFNETKAGHAFVCIGYDVDTFRIK